MKRAIALLLVTVLAFASSGCGLIFTGTHEEVPVQTNVPAQVWLDGELVGQTPVTLKLDSTEDHTLVLRRPGFHDVTVRITRSVGAGWVVLDILLAIVPVIIDAATGGWFSLDQEYVSVSLPPAGPPPPGYGPAPPGYGAPPAGYAPGPAGGYAPPAQPAPAPSQPQSQPR